jgi:hypothetical protein
VYFEFMAPIFVMACHFSCVPCLIFEVMNSNACECVLNNIFLIIIMTTILIVVLKKVTHNSLIF